MKARKTISAIGNDANVSTQRTRRGAKAAAAFTLIEVLLAVVILGFGIVGIMRSYAVAARGLAASGARIEALCLAKEALARLEQPAFPATSLPPGNYIQTATGVFLPGSKWILKIGLADEESCRKATIELSRKQKAAPGGFCLYGYVAP